MLFDWDQIKEFLYIRLSPRNSELAQKIAHQSGKTIKQYILSYGLILLITFTELSIGFLIIGFDNAFLLVALLSMVIGNSLMGGVGLFGLPIALAVITKMNRDGVIRLFNTLQTNSADETRAQSAAKG